MRSFIGQNCILFICASFLFSCAHTIPEQSDKRAKIHYQIGLDALQRGQLPKAFDELMQSNKVEPNQPETLEVLAYAWRLQGNMKQAESFYKQAISAGGKSAVYTNYGGLLVSLHRYKEAEIMLRKALEDPRYRNQYIALINLGDALMGQKQADEAIRSYRKAAMMNPKQNISQLREAQVYVKTGRLNYAQALYETMLRKQPTLRPALEGLIDLLIKHSDIGTARKHLARYLEKEKDPLNRAWASDELIRLGHL
ncbi:MAG: tetratricopeptide repeat protein [Mariprofundaceae bacterium]|nr:tetratricopeptide repeat protein [Mariprofundaceae bacterium]